MTSDQSRMGAAFVVLEPLPGEISNGVGGGVVSLAGGGEGGGGEGGEGEGGGGEGG